MVSTQDTFQTTLSNFKKRLTQKELEDFQFTTLEDVWQEAARIQSIQETSKTMMNMTRIQSFLEAMDQFGQIIEVFLNTSDVLAFVWGPIKFLLKVWKPSVTSYTPSKSLHTLAIHYKISGPACSRAS